MTILFAYIGEKEAAVAGEGNVFSGGKLVGSKKDKTFSLYDGKIVGAFSNNMGIDHRIYGKDVGIGRVIEIIAEGIELPNTLGDFVDSFIDPYTEILNSQGTTAPPMEQRSSNILLAGSRDFDGTNFEIYRLRFKQDRDGIQLKRKEGPYTGIGTWYVAPPDEEFKQIFDAIQEFFNSAPRLAQPKLAEKGIEIGIDASKIMKHGVKLLGGKITTKTTNY